MRKLICLDFDGVIHEYTSPWSGPTAISDQPVVGAIPWMHRAIQEADLAVYSSRSGHEGGIQAMQNWLHTHAGPLWEDTPVRRGLVHLQWPITKPAALVTLDDRAITFSGVWPDLDRLLAFKPWNKR